MDYSKWNNIVISDDEDETYPKDRWGHQARVDHMEEFKKKKEFFEKKKTEHDRKVSEYKRRLSELEIENEEIKKMGEELEKEEKKIPWNVDTICKPGFSKSLINTKPKEKTVFDEERKSKMIPTDQMMYYGMIDSYYESRNYLREHPHLLCKCTVVHLSNWCVQLEMQEKHSMVDRVAHQVIYMGVILDMAEARNCDPKIVVDDFFTAMRERKIHVFGKALKHFKEEITRAVKLIKDKKQCQTQLGPVYLDPQEFFESLPIELKIYFETLSIRLLQEIVGMRVEDYYFH